MALKSKKNKNKIKSKSCFGDVGGLHLRRVLMVIDRLNIGGKGREKLRWNIRYMAYYRETLTSTLQKT